MLVAPDETPEAIIRDARMDGVHLVLTPRGTIKACGASEAVAFWRPIILTHKPALLAVLTRSSPEAEEAAFEATEERAAILEYDGGLTRPDADAVSALAAAFYRHLFGPARETRCCNAPRTRYCAEGQRLRDAYFEAAGDVPF